MTLDIQPQPDSVRRVFFVVRGLDKPMSLVTPSIEAFERTGFSVLERGVLRELQ